MKITITNLVTDNFNISIQEPYSIAIENIDFNTGNITIKDDTVSSSVISLEPQSIYFTGQAESFDLTPA